MGWSNGSVDGSRGRSRLLAAMFLVVLLTVAGVVFAAWLVSGSGTGAATAGTVLPLTITPGTPSDSLYPGGSASVAVTVNNPNPFPVVITEFNLSGPITSDSTECNTNGHLVTFQNPTGSWGVPASDSATIQLDDVASMGADSADACQGATFTIPLTAVASSGTTSTTAPTSTTSAGTDADADGYTTADGDCDDADSNVYPGASEVIGDGLDNDCNGVIDG